MAITQSTAVLAGNAYKSLGAFVRSFEVPVPTNVLDQTDSLECVPVFAGETVLDVAVIAPTDLDTGTGALRVNVGDRTTADKFVAGGDVAPDTLVRASKGVGVQYSADDAISIAASVAANVAAAGTLIVMVTLQAQ